MGPVSGPLIANGLTGVIPPRSHYSHYPFKGGVPSCNRLIDLASTTMEVEILAIFFFKQTAGSW